MKTKKSIFGAWVRKRFLRPIKAQPIKARGREIDKLLFKQTPL